MWSAPTNRSDARHHRYTTVQWFISNGASTAFYPLYKCMLPWHTHDILAYEWNLDSICDHFCSIR